MFKIGDKVVFKSVEEMDHDKDRYLIQGQKAMKEKYSNLEPLTVKLADFYYLAFDEIKNMSGGDYFFSASFKLADPVEVKKEVKKVEVKEEEIPKTTYVATAGAGRCNAVGLSYEEACSVAEEWLDTTDISKVYIVQEKVVCVMRRTVSTTRELID